MNLDSLVATLPKERRLVLTVYLTLVLLANVVALCGYSVYFYNIREALSQRSIIFNLMVLACLAGLLVNVFCMIALLRWKKWGFWVFCSTNLLFLAITLNFRVDIWSGITSILGEIMAPLILYLILQDTKVWPQLD